MEKVDYAHYRWSKEAANEIRRIQRRRRIRQKLYPILRTLTRLRDAIPWAFGRGAVVGHSYCPHCGRDIDDCQLW